MDRFFFMLGLTSLGTKLQNSLVDFIDDSFNAGFFAEFDICFYEQK